MALSHWHLLAGKTAAITGSTTGIGRAIALEFMRQGCNVAINHLGLDRDKPHLHSMIAEATTLYEEGRKDATGTSKSAAGEFLELAGDVTAPETGQNLVEATVKRWGKLDIFVSNAGVFQPAEFLT